MAQLFPLPLPLGFSHPTDKVPFQAMAAQDKKRYEKEMSDYEPTPGYEKATKRR